MPERKLTRLTGFDYTSNRYYYVTICVKDRIQSFGTIGNSIMNLSPSGIIANEQWIWLGNKYQYIDLISFVIMPDHIHGIIKINSDYYDNAGNGRDHSLHNTIDHSLLKIKPLSEIIGAYKTTVSKRIHLAGDMEFKWQKSFHDHIIRNLQSLNRIKNYIEMNAENWIEIQ